MIGDNMDKIAELTDKILKNEDSNVDLYDELVLTLAEADVYCPVKNNEIPRMHGRYIPASTTKEDFKEAFNDMEFKKFKFTQLEEFMTRADLGIFLNPGSNYYILTQIFAEMVFNCKREEKPVSGGYDVKVRLNDFRPITWIDLIIPENMTFMELDNALKTIWEFGGTHLSCFLIRKHNLIITDEDLAEETMMGCDFEANSTAVAEIFEKFSKVTYWYDFGDDWQFDIEVKKKIDYDKDYITIKRFKGKYLPLEDCGGPYAFSQIVNNPEKSDDADYLEEFDLELTQLFLKHKGYVKSSWHRDVFFNI